MPWVALRSCQALHAVCRCHAMACIEWLVGCIEWLVGSSVTSVGNLQSCSFGSNLECRFTLFEPSSVVPVCSLSWRVVETQFKKAKICSGWDSSWLQRCQCNLSGMHRSVGVYIMHCVSVQLELTPPILGVHHSMFENFTSTPSGAKTCSKFAWFWWHMLKCKCSWHFKTCRPIVLRLVLYIIQASPDAFWSKLSCKASQHACPIYIFAWLTTELRVLSVLCKQMHSNM